METNTAPLQAVPAVDLARYAGKWYEIARVPFRFEDDCTGDVTATYTLCEDGEIAVVNACRKADGEMKHAEGTARLTHKDGPTSQLQVSFTAPFLHFLPFVWGDYWVIELDTEYQWAVVGEPDRKYLWILSRTPQMEPATYESLISKIVSHGYDPGKLTKTVQSQ